jgi:5-methyltetrahydrofolate--homocysteine methyltransferase
MDTSEIVGNIKESIIQGRINSEDEGFDEGLEGQPATVELLEEAIARGVDAKAIVIDGLTAGMNLVGENFQNGKYLIPDMLASAEAVGTAMDLLAPILEKAGVQSRGKVVMATVAGDLHDIGKNIVSIMLKGAGYEMVDLGSDVPTGRIIEAVEEHAPRFLGLSALLTTTMREMENVIKALEEKGMRRDIKVLIGGAPTSEEFSRNIGADAYCADAFQAVDYANSMGG